MQSVADHPLAVPRETKQAYASVVERLLGRKGRNRWLDWGAAGLVMAHLSRVAVAGGAAVLPHRTVNPHTLGREINDLYEKYRSGDFAPTTESWVVPTLIDIVYRQMRDKQ